MNNDNVLHDIVFKDGEWQKGGLSQLKGEDGKIGIRCAPYSRLAAATVNLEGQGEIFCVYYQAEGKHGPVRMVNFLPGHSWHTTYWPDGRITVNWVDPPLYGTSLTAVKPREGILVAKDAKEQQLPIVYLQWDTQALAECQGPSMFSFHHPHIVIDVLESVLSSRTEIQPIPGLETMQLSPHTSLTTVDDGSNLYCFYKTNDNSVQMVRIGDGKCETVLNDVSTPTPQSSIAAVMPLQHKNRIILFYQRWDKGNSEKIDIRAKTLSRGTRDSWEVATETLVLSG